MKLNEGLKGRASRDFCALECLANDPRYAKPDSQKSFLLWEAKLLKTVKNPVKDGDTDGIKIEKITGGEGKHDCVYSLFIGQGVVRFPFNTWDTESKYSLSWESILPCLLADKWEERLLLLPRWSTASRSCLALIPEHIDSLKKVEKASWEKVNKDGTERDAFFGRRLELAGDAWPNVPEWEGHTTNRFFEVVGDPGTASILGISTKPDPTRPAEVDKCRLYSVKTGVTYIGSRKEGLHGKNRLEANCSMAMRRSEVIQGMPNRDFTFGVQTEVLTITAPLNEFDDDGNAARDGFQVRDLSCMLPGLNYMPGQAIPYAREAFDTLLKGEATNEDYADKQCEFWRNAFAVPLGRAKARLFLNYGLVHTSANAQNFLIGFAGSTPRQFVARDIGDTSWHDDYLNKYFRQAQVATKVHGAFTTESNSKIKHVLCETSSGAYPPPRMVRLAAYSLLTHGFAEKLQEKEKKEEKKNGWGQPQIYRFATGILDGFRDFIQEAFKLAPLYPKEPGNPIGQADIIDYGIYGRYPCAPKGKLLTDYEQRVKKALAMEADALFKQAARVRQCGAKLKSGEFKSIKGDGDPISTLINAEEILMCAGFEILLITKPADENNIRKQVESCLEGRWPRIFPEVEIRRKSV